jgi:hypothetical protein
MFSKQVHHLTKNKHVQSSATFGHRLLRGVGRRHNRERITELRTTLENLLSETPALSLYAASERVGLPLTYLKKLCPSSVQHSHRDMSDGGTKPRCSEKRNSLMKYAKLSRTYIFKESAPQLNARVISATAELAERMEGIGERSEGSTRRDRSLTASRLPRVDSFIPHIGEIRVQNGPGNCIPQYSSGAERKHNVAATATLWFKSQHNMSLER